MFSFALKKGGEESFLCEIISVNSKEISRSTQIHSNADSAESSEKQPDNLTAAEQPKNKTTLQRFIAGHGKKIPAKIVKDNSRQRWFIFGGLGLVCFFCIYKCFGYKYIPIFK